VSLLIDSNALRKLLRNSSSALSSSRTKQPSETVRSIPCQAREPGKDLQFELVSENVIWDSVCRLVRVSDFPRCVMAWMSPADEPLDSVTGYPSPPADFHFYG
jgi:hypothetical protein